MTPLMNNLAEAHATWMQSPSLQKVFKYHYPSEIKDTAGQYSEHLKPCIEDTQGWKACADLYKQWLNTIVLRRFEDPPSQTSIHE